MILNRERRYIYIYIYIYISKAQIWYNEVWRIVRQSSITVVTHHIVWVSGALRSIFIPHSKDMGMAGTAEPHFSNKNIKFFFSSIHFNFLKQLFWRFQRCFHDISVGNGSVCVMRPPRHRVHCLAVINSHNPCVDTPGKLLLIIFSLDDFLLAFTSAAKWIFLLIFVLIIG